MSSDASQSLPCSTSTIFSNSPPPYIHIRWIRTGKLWPCVAELGFSGCRRNWRPAILMDPREMAEFGLPQLPDYAELEAGLRDEKEQTDELLERAQQALVVRLWVERLVRRSRALQRAVVVDLWSR